MDSFGKKLNNSLKAHGVLFPENIEQLSSFFKEIENIDVPDNITNAEDEFNFKRKRITKTISLNKDESAINNLAQAARKGSNIPDDILKKMRKDRNDSNKGEK